MRLVQSSDRCASRLPSCKGLHAIRCARAPSTSCWSRRALELDPVLEANLDAEAARMHAILEPTQAVQACRDTNVECPGANARARCGFGTPT